MGKSVTKFRVKEWMVKRDVSRAELAGKVGVSETTITNVCVERAMPSMQVLFDIARVLDVDVRDLIVPTKGNSYTEEQVNKAKELLQQSLDVLR
jgi:DNA-binding XRE family transcriptional regulator